MDFKTLFENEILKVKATDAFIMIACVHDGKETTNLNDLFFLNNSLVLCLCPSCAARLKVEYLEELFKKAVAEKMAISPSHLGAPLKIEVKHADH